MSTYRGSWRRGSAPPSSHRSYPRRQLREEPPRPPSPELGSLLKVIDEKDLREIPEENQSPKISNTEFVASYNWLNNKEPTILIPGRPPAWTPLPKPIKLAQDGGEYFRDPNAARYPKHPIEPAVQAVLTVQPDFPASSINIFACGSTFGNLLRFVRKVDGSFRMLVEVVGTTVFFIRRENSPTQLISGVRGYGHTFPEAYTTWDPDVKGSVSHQRIVRYTFGGLNCLVRFQSDGFYREMATKESLALLKTQEHFDEVSF